MDQNFWFIIVLVLFGLNCLEISYLMVCHLQMKETRGSVERIERVFMRAMDARIDELRRQGMPLRAQELRAELENAINEYISRHGP